MYARLTYVYSEGEKVMVTVMRGQEKITKEVAPGGNEVSAMQRLRA
ncbi:MAG: hypothetical protein WA604_19055 [Candidatus Sulfotelmatobacter sp.]